MSNVVYATTFHEEFTIPVYYRLGMTMLYLHLLLTNTSGAYPHLQVDASVDSNGLKCPSNHLYFANPPIEVR